MGQPGRAGVTADRRPRLVTEVRRLGVTVAVGALLVVVLVGFRLGYSLLVAQPAINRLHHGVAALGNSHQAMLDEETGLRGYLATADPLFLQPSAAAGPTLAASNTEMAQLLAEPRLRSEVLDVLLTQQRWQHEWADAARAGPLPAAPTSFLVRGKQLFDDYRSRQAALRSDTLDTLADADQADTAVQWAVLVAALLVGLATLGLALRGRRRMQRNVVAPVEGLLDAVRGIEEGRLVPPAPVDGSAEFADLRDALADMTVALRREREGTTAHANRLTAQADRLRAILVMAREIGGSLNTRYVVETTVAAVVRLTGGPVLLWTVEEDHSGMGLVHDSRHGPVLPTDGERFDFGVGLVGRAARYGQISRAEPDGEDRTSIAVPLVVGARVIGVLECMSDGVREIDGQAIGAVELLATLAGAAIEASRLHAATERLSQFDPLTALANRRRLNADLASAVAGAKRHGHPMALVMMDIDHFKALNDRYGHQQGDVVLQEVGAALRASMRDGESAYRYGGEEFAILVSIGDAGEAEQLAERLRSRIEREFHRGGRQLITASFGVAGLPADAEDGEDLIAMADRALYVAKNSGRNRVVSASGMTVSSVQATTEPLVGP